MDRVSPLAFTRRANELKPPGLAYLNRFRHIWNVPRKENFTAKLTSNIGVRHLKKIVISVIRDIKG